MLENLASPAVLAPLPALAGEDIFTADQWTTLLAICDTFIPPVTAAEEATSRLKSYMPQQTEESTANLNAYFKETASSHPDFKSSLHRKLGHYVPASALKGLSFILTALNTRLGCLFLISSPTPFHEHSLASRTTILASWATARLPLLRGLFRSFSGLAKQTWLTVSPTFPKVITFPTTPAHIERNENFKFEFKQFQSTDETITLSTDVLIVGSGCGAGVCALNLASAGHKVLVIEKSYHFPASHFPMDRSSSGVHLMENGGSIVSDDQSIAVLAGSTWGGGGTVNWSASLQPQHFVREEWSRSGLPFATSADFQDCLDSVCSRMGVARSNDEAQLSKIEQNFANRTLLEGARRLGYLAKVVPQNTGGKRHFCGYCGEGCASATKQGPANYWLPQAASKGAEFIEGCWAEEVIFETEGGIKKATGIKGTWTSRDRSFTRRLIINARRVVISAGTLNSPLLLMRSGLTNQHIGRNLHLHPVSVACAVWPEEVRPWEGSILTAAVTSFENMDGLHHGPKIEVIASTPGYLLPFLPWRASLGENAGLEFKLTCAKFHHMTGFISLQRDRDTGRVYIDPDDKTRRQVRVAYTPSPRDLSGVVEGVIAASRIAYTMGASEIINFHPDAETFVRDTSLTQAENDQSFERYAADIRKRGFSSPDPCMLGSAHQMGTCKMGSDAKSGVVDQQGKVWGTEGLYVADASVFPSATGVNPMITTMGIAEWISRGLIKEMARDTN